MNGPDAVRRADARAADTAHAASAIGHAVGSVVCYCGLYDECPQWDRMTDDERRSCSADKRATVESLWKVGVHQG